MKNYNYEDDENMKNLNINESLESNNKKLLVQGGIDPERIVNKEYLTSLGDFYKCSICFKIMINPKDCEECGHSYCYECISTLNCPFGCKTKSIKNTSAGIINLLKNLKFKCQNEGCTMIIPYEEVKNHDTNCEYQKVFCTNKKCKKRIIKKELDDHIKNICKYSLINCQYCKNDYYRKEINEHEKLCIITYKYLENYKKGKNLEEINEIISQYDNNTIFNQKYFNKYLQDLSNIISNILKDNLIKKDSNELKDNKIKEENEQKENNENKNDNIINNYKMEESKDTVFQLDENDLLDFIKKVVEKKLKKQFETYDFNIFEFGQLINIIKGCVCQLNTIEEVQESDEDDNEEEEINKNIKIKKNKSNNENIHIKELLKKFIEDSELKIKTCLSQLNDSISLKIRNDKINLELIKKDEKKLTIGDINKNIDSYMSKINDCIKESKSNLINIYKQIDETKNINNCLIEKEESHKNNIKLQIKNILDNLIEKNQSNEINNIIKNKNENIKEIYEEKSKLMKSEINKSLNEKNDIIKQEILKLNKEIEQIKGFINDIKTLIIEQSNNVSNNIQNQTYKSDNNTVEKIIYNAFNQPNIYVRSRIKTIKTVQPRRLNLQNMNININTDKKIKSNNRTKSAKKKYNSTQDKLPFVNVNKNILRSYSSNSIYFRDSIKKSINIDNDLVMQIIKIESKIKNIYDNILLVPEKVNEEIIKDVMNYFDGLKQLIDKNLEEKIKDKFKPKFCEECQKVECFYCFKRCFNCKIEFCLNNIILCRNCKNFFCKDCYQKSHKCI